MPKSIKKSEFVSQYIIPYLRENDKPGNRLLWNVTGDMLIKDGSLSLKRFEQWTKTPKKYYGEE